MKTKFKNLAFLFLLLLSVNYTLSAQQQSEESYNTQSDAYRILSAASETNPIIFNYKETPSFALNGFQRSMWTKYSDEQIKIFEEYNCPKFISYGMKTLEKDILDYQNAYKKWEKDNAYRADEILTKLGIKK